MGWLETCALAACLFVPGAALGQTDRSAPGTVQAIRKVERGVFAQLEAGPLYLVAPDASAELGLGLGAAVHFGFDILPILHVSLGGSAVVVSGSEEVGGAVALRDRLYLMPTVRAQFAVLATDRDYLWVRAEGGLSVLPNAAELVVGGESLGPMFGGSVAYEHFSVLRRFSFGIELGASAFLSPDLAVAIRLSPTVRYTF